MKQLHKVKPCPLLAKVNQLQAKVAFWQNKSEYWQVRCSRFAEVARLLASCETQRQHQQDEYEKRYGATGWIPPRRALYLESVSSIDNAQLMVTSLELLETLQEISEIVIDIGLDVTPAESPARDLVIRIHHLATDAAMKATRRPSD